MRVILLLAVNPKGTTPLRLDEEVKRIEQVIERSRRRDEFRLVVKWAVTDDEFRHALLAHEPEIVHFLGHGTGAGPGGLDRHLIPGERSDDSGLAFEDESGKILKIGGEPLARVFELIADQVKCVVLNACFSDRQSEAIARHVDYVIGMNKAIGDAAAIKFAVGFYDAIVAGKSYETAFKFGRSAIDLKGIPELLTPVLRRKPSPGAAASHGPPATPQAGAPAPRKPDSSALDSREVKRASADLADYIGPIAYMIASEMASRARSLEHFYELLGSEIPSNRQRERFLQSRSR